MNSKQAADKLVKAVASAKKELPAEVQTAVNDVLATVKGPGWWKAPFFTDGRFSKTAMFATLANVLVLVAYVLSWFQGSTFGPWTVPAFDTGAAAAILAIVNGTYVGNKFATKVDGGDGA